MGFRLQNNLDSKLLKYDYYPDFNEHRIKIKEVSPSNNIICNGRNCENLASIKIEEPCGEFGVISFSLCPNCAKNFKNDSENYSSLYTVS